MVCCLTAPSHYLNQCWLISKVLWSSSVRAISQEMPQSSITKICLKITCLQFHSNFPGANELKYYTSWCSTATWRSLSCQLMSCLPELSPQQLWNWACEIDGPGEARINHHRISYWLGVKKEPGLALIRCQAMTRTSDDQYLWHKIIRTFIQSVTLDPLSRSVSTEPAPSASPVTRRSRTPDVPDPTIVLRTDSGISVDNVPNPGKPKFLSMCFFMFLYRWFSARKT